MTDSDRSSTKFWRNSVLIRLSSLWIRQMTEWDYNGKKENRKLAAEIQAVISWFNLWSYLVLHHLYVLPLSESKTNSYNMFTCGVSPSESVPQSQPLRVSPSESAPQSQPSESALRVSPQRQPLRVSPSESVPQSQPPRVSPPESAPQSQRLRVSASESVPQSQSPWDILWC